MDAATVEMLRSTLTHVLSQDDGQPLSSRLDALGWDDVLADDAAGALQVLFETRGVTLSGADALGPVLARSLAGAVGDPNLAAAAVVLPSSLHPDRPSAVVDGGGSLVVDGFVLSAPAVGQMLVVPVDGGEAGMRLAMARAGSELSTKAVAVDGTDISLDIQQVRCTVAAADVTWVNGSTAAAAWTEAAALARWVLAAELVAIGRHVIAQAVEYTGQRQQYGKAIGTFQALQHRLASAHVTVVGASHVVAEAADSGSPWAALVAKALAGRGTEFACTQVQQSYGAIGFTWEHGFHRYLRRVYVLDRLFGDWRTLERDIGSRLLATGTVPRLGTL